MSFTIKVDGTNEVKQMFAQLGDDAGHALRIAANSLGEHAQRTMRQRLADRFTMRGTREGFERAVIFQAAKSNNPRRTQAVLKVGSDQGGTKATGTRRLGLILARHEEASTRSSAEVYRAGGKTFVGGFFIPAKGLRTASANPPRSLYPSAIGAKMRTQPDGTGIFAKSKRKTRSSKGNVVRGESFYVIPNVGIFRRRQSQFGSLRGGSVMSDGEPIWWFNQRIRTPARLGLWETAQEVFDRFAVSYAIDAVDLVIARTSPKRLL